jgi:hypothetical protein
MSQGAMKILVAMINFTLVEHFRHFKVLQIINPSDGLGSSGGKSMAGGVWENRIAAISPK